MGKTSTLTVSVVGDTSSAVADLNATSTAVGKLSTAVSTAATDVAASASKITADTSAMGRDVSGAVAGVGDSAGTTASGLSALSGAFDAAGFTGVSTAMNLTATAMDAAEGSTMLFKVAQEVLNITTLKTTAATIANGAATVATTVAQTAASAASKAWAATQWLLNAALSANPIGLIIAGIAALIGVIVLIATKTTFFQDTWNAAWTLIQAGLKAVKGPIDAVVDAFNAVVDAVKNVIDWLKKIKVPQALSDAAGFIGGIFGKSAVAPPAAVSGVLTPAALGARTGGGSRSAGGAVNITVNVPEASDPVATARYLKAIIRRGEAAGVLFGGT